MVSLCSFVLLMSTNRGLVGVFKRELEMSANIATLFSNVGISLNEIITDNLTCSGLSPNL